MKTSKIRPLPADKHRVIRTTEFPTIVNNATIHTMTRMLVPASRFMVDDIPKYGKTASFLLF